MKLILPLIFFCLSMTNAISAERVPGSPITMTPPAGLQAATRFSGFVDEEYGTSITITELPGPVDEINQGLAKEKLASRGLNFVSKEEIRLGDDTGTLIQATQIAYDVEFYKWILTIGNTQKTVVINASYQSALHEEWAPRIKKSLLTIRWTPSNTSDLFEGLPYSIKDGEHLKIAGKMGSSIYLTLNGEKFGKQPYTGPFVIVAPSLGNLYDAKQDKKTFAEAGMRSVLKKYSNLKILNKYNTSISGFDAVTFLVEATKTSNNKEIFAHVTIVFQGQALYVFNASADLSDRKKYEPEFLNILSSLNIN